MIVDWKLLIFIDPNQTVANQFYCQKIPSKMLKITRSLIGVAKNIQCTSRITSHLQSANKAFVVKRSFHCSRPTFGIEEFFDTINTKEAGVVTGRAWTAADLRRKVKKLSHQCTFTVLRHVSYYCAHRIYHPC